MVQKMVQNAIALCLITVSGHSEVLSRGFVQQTPVFDPHPNQFDTYLSQRGGLRCCRTGRETV